jgi:Uma2 family endonuclease
MSTVAKSPRSPRQTRKLPHLENGDRLNQKTFHARYEAMPNPVRAELIGGIVYMASPQKRRHSSSQSETVRWLQMFEEATPGTEVLINNTHILGPDSEPQADVSLCILPEHGGQVRENEDGYLTGPPDLMVEISWSTESIDLNDKKLDYEKAGVREYIVVALRKKVVYWFVRRRGKFKDLPADADGIYRSQVFPGLWLDAAALLRGDRKRLLAVLREGLASPAHAAFVAKLARR